MKSAQETTIQKRKSMNESLNLRGRQLEDDTEDSQSATELPHRGRPPKNLQHQHQRSLLLSSPSKRERRLKREQQLAAVQRQQQQKMQGESFVMKLFDRSLDLSQYTEETSLYPICRAWMHNKPRNAPLGYRERHSSPQRQERPDNGEEVLAKLRGKELREISLMPAPADTDLPQLPKQPPKDAADIGAKLDKEMQSAHKYDGTGTEDMSEAEEPAATSREELLGNHLKQWKRLKSHWLQHQKRYQKRHEINYHIIHELYKP